MASLQGPHAGLHLNAFRLIGGHHVVPVLRHRGLFRSEYTGTTVHEHYGLPRPENRLVARLEAPLAASGS